MELINVQDATLKRCFGEDRKIVECDWDYLSTKRTIKTPHESMPRLKDLLEYVASSGLENIWILLDIKVRPRSKNVRSSVNRSQLDNDAEDVMRLIGETIRSTAPGRIPW